MQMRPIAAGDLPSILERVARDLTGAARTAFRRVTAEPLLQISAPYDTPEHRRAAIALATRLGLDVVDAAPQDAFSWDGTAVRTRSEAYVLIHEVAHWQLCPADRLGVPDFGLGCGPESGRREEADRARCVDDETEVREEQRASLLGILWEAELGQPALNAFLEQNWLEGWERGQAAVHFRSVLDDLVALGLATPDGRPLPGNVRSGGDRRRDPPDIPRS